MPKIDLATNIPMPSVEPADRHQAISKKSGSARINIVVTPAELAHIKASCARNGLSMTTFLKEAINLGLELKGEPKVDWKERVS